MKTWRRANSSARPANAQCHCESVFCWCCSIRKFTATSAPGVDLWWGKRSSRGRDRLSGRDSEKLRAQFLPRSMLFGNRRDRHWTYEGTIYSVASGPRRSDVRLANLSSNELGCVNPRAILQLGVGLRSGAVRSRLSVDRRWAHFTLLSRSNMTFSTCLLTQ